MMNLLNIIIPTPVYYSGGGRAESMLLAWWCFLLVFFTLIVIPCIVYIYWYFKKGDGRFSHFSLGNIPILPASIISVFILLATTFGLLHITFLLYNVIY